MSDELSESVRGINDTLDVHSSSQSTSCVLCGRLISSDHHGGDLEAVSICDDCKFLFAEDTGTPIHEVYLRRRGLRRRRRRRRRRRYSSSGSIENLFSQQFSHMIGLARNDPAVLLEHENTDVAARFSQHVSLHSTPTVSGRWRSVLSDTESDGFSSQYGESESNVSISGYRHFHGDSGSLSYSASGGYSDASVDAHSFMENDTFVNLGGSSNFDTDTDVDPMHAGLYHWNSGDQEEEVGDENNVWGEGDDEESVNDSWRGSGRLRRSTSPEERRATVNSHGQINLLEFEGVTRLSIHEMRRASIASISVNLEEELETHNYAGNYQDFLNTRRFEELLERFGGRGAPPAAVAFVENLPRIVINKDHDDLVDLTCVICKDAISLGTVVNELPCFHRYHPSCITPWLSARNSCPLCRYELPTDDQNYENQKQMGSIGLDLHEVQQPELNGDGSSDFSDGTEADEHDELGNDRRMHRERFNMNGVAGSSGRINTRSSFFHAAAAPIISIAGIVLVLWLRNSLTARRLPSGSERQQLNSYLDPCPSSRRVVDAERRRWWSLF